MSSAVVSTSAALGRPFVFVDEAAPEVCPPSTPKNHVGAIGTRKPAIENFVTPASHLEIRPAPEMVSSGIAAIDALAGGLPRSCLTEICGPASSGRTTVLLAALAAATTRRGEVCALVDVSDSLDPQSVAAAGIALDRLLWVRCAANSPQRHRGTEENLGNASSGSPIKPIGVIPKPRAFTSEGRACPERTTSGSEWESNGDLTWTITQPKLNPHHSTDSELPKKHASILHRLEQALRSTDLLLESGGFGLVVLDLADLPLTAARRVPLSLWFRFRRAVEHTPAVLLSIAQQPIAGSCSSLLVQLRSAASNEEPNDDISHARLFTGLDIHAELIRSRLERKPVRSISAAFTSKTAWAG